MWMCLTPSVWFHEPLPILSDPMFQPRDYLPFLSMVCMFPGWWICLPHCLSYVTYSHIYPEILTTLKGSSHVYFSVKPFLILTTNICILIYASITLFFLFHMTFHILYCMMVNFLHMFLMHEIIISECFCSLHSTPVYKPHIGDRWTFVDGKLSAQNGITLIVSFKVS